MACPCKGDGMNNLFNVLAETPFEILGKWDYGITQNADGSWSTATRDFMTTLGFRELAYVLNVLGIWSAIFVIFCGMIVLVVVNYPKTVSQVKTKIVQAILIVASIGALPFMFDVLGGLVTQFVLGN